MKRGLVVSGLVFFFVSVIFVSSFILANSSEGSGDVAYVLKRVSRVDQGFLNALTEKGFTVDFIEDKDIKNTNFSAYDLVFVQDGRLRNAAYIDIQNQNSIITSYNHGDVFGLTDRDGVSKYATNVPMVVKADGEVVQVYTKTYPILRRSALQYYYLANENKLMSFQTVASTSVGYDTELGDVISYYEGTRGENGIKRTCFYGIIKTRYWTEEAKQLFTDCVDFVLGDEEDDNDECDYYEEECDGEQLPYEPICGNEILEEGEGCDDGNAENGDGCNEFCEIETPEPPVTEGWYCEVENSTRTDCLSFSNPNSEGLITRCYLNEEKTSWDSCSSGWVEV